MPRTNRVTPDVYVVRVYIAVNRVVPEGVKLESRL